MMGYTRLGEPEKGVRVSTITVRPVAEKKLDLWYSKILAIVSIANFLLLCLLCGFVVLVFLNLTFVFSPALEHSDVPFYDTLPLTTVLFGAERYSLHYQLIGLIMIKFKTLFASYGAIVHASRGGGTFLIAAVILWVILAALLDVILAVYWLILAYTPAKCAQTKLCRSWTAVSGDLPDVAGDPNWAFLAVAWQGVAWLVPSVLLAWVLLKVYASVNSRVTEAAQLRRIKAGK